MILRTIERSVLLAKRYYIDNRPVKPTEYLKWLIEVFEDDGWATVSTRYDRSAHRKVVIFMKDMEQGVARVE